MTNANAEDRAGTLASFRRVAVKLFRAHPQLRSVMLAVAQYWNDQADDEVHSMLVASPRDIPAWPHHCDDEWNDDPLVATPGDRCWDCFNYDGYESVDVGVEAFEPYCHEFGSQENDAGANYLPYAIARRGAGDAVELEIIGKLVRPAQDMLDEASDDEVPWLALPRAPALYELVCASPADDGPRRVLADYLLEHDQVRGEYIALALADSLDAAATARRDELFATYGRYWLGALDEVIPASGAHWARGFLARADVYWHDKVAAAAVSPVWGTVETIRFLGKHDMIELEMVALRDVGPVRAGLVDLAAAPRPWAIERLHAVLDQAARVDALWRATTLPRLRHLVLEGDLVESALARPRPAWWRQLARLTLRLDSKATEPLEARCAMLAGIAPWVAVAQTSAITGAPGWEVAIGPAGQIELSLAGWHESANPRALVELIEGLPRDADVALAPSPYWAPLAEDAERISAEAGRPVRVKS